MPKMLIADHKRQRIESSREILELSFKEKAAFLDLIVTEDKTWVYHFSRQNRNNIQWNGSIHFPLKKENLMWRNLLEKLWQLSPKTGKGFFSLNLCELGPSLIRPHIVKRMKNCVKP